MNISTMWIAVILLACANSYAQSNQKQNIPTDEEVEKLLLPSKGKNRHPDYKNFEKKTEIPAITIQNIPRGQVIFRIGALKAISRDIESGAESTSLTYSSKNISKEGWKRITIPRENKIFGEAVTVYILKIDHAKKEVEISIRGTVNFDDVLQDIKASAVLDEDLGFRVHSGFRSLARDIRDHLKNNELSSEVINTYKFRFSGHSMGGAIASILSMYFHQEGATVASVVTFGAPRFTTNEGTRKYQVLNQVTHRVVRCDDVIPFMPPPNFFGWSNESYQANGNIFLMLKPPFFDYSVGIDIERDFTYQLRLDLENKSTTKILAFGHRMENYHSQLFKFSSVWLKNNPKNTPGEIGHTGVEELRPVSYTLASQSDLCPAQVAAIPLQK